jgi:hypothetical protein
VWAGQVRAHMGGVGRGLVPGEGGGQGGGAESQHLGLEHLHSLEHTSTEAPRVSPRCTRQESRAANIHKRQACRNGFENLSNKTHSKLWAFVWGPTPMPPRA